MSLTRKITSAALGTALLAGSVYGATSWSSPADLPTPADISSQESNTSLEQANAAAPQGSFLSGLMEPESLGILALASIGFIGRRRWDASHSESPKGGSGNTHIGSGFLVLERQ